jgi:hypothetical protein
MNYTPSIEIDYGSDLTTNTIQRGWVDISSDVLMSPDIKWEYGIRTSGIGSRTATSGTLSFSLDNKNKKYSLETSEAVDGFGIGNRVRVRFSGDTLYDTDYMIVSSDVSQDDVTFYDGLYHLRVSSTDGYAALQHFATDGYPASDGLMAGDFSISVWMKISSDHDWTFTTDVPSHSVLAIMSFDDVAYAALGVYLIGTGSTSDGTYNDSIQVVASASTDEATVEYSKNGSTDWMNIVATASASDNALCIYVNGSLVAKTTCSSDLGTLGTSTDFSELILFGGGNASLASFAHLATFNRALTQNEAQAIYEHTEFQEDILYALLGGPPVRYWRLGGKTSASQGEWSESPMETENANVYTKFVGRISDVRVQSDIGGDKIAEVTVTDWIDRAARFEPGPVPIQVSQLTGKAIENLLGYSLIFPMDISIDEGTFTPTYSLNKGENSNILSQLAKLARSEPGYIYVRGGASSDGDPGEVFVFEDKNERQLSASTDVVLTLSDGGTSDFTVPFRMEMSLSNLYDDVIVTVHPSAVDADPTVVYQLDTNTTITLPGQSQTTIDAEYTNSDTSYELVGALDVVTPVRNVDYEILNNIGGADMSGDLREAIKATSSDTLIAFYPLTDTSTYFIREEVVSNSAASGSSSSRRTSSAGVSGTGSAPSTALNNSVLALISEGAVFRTYADAVAAVLSLTGA